MSRSPLTTGTSQGPVHGGTERRKPATGPAALAARRGLLPRVLLTVVLNIVVPLVVYVLVRPEVGSDAAALAIGASIPVVLTAVGFVVRRRVDPVGAIAVVSAAVAFVVLLLSGDNPLALKLQDALVTGPLGAACLLSVLVRRPLLEYVRRVTASRANRPPSALSGAALRHAMSVLTALIGGTLFVHALLMLVLALTLSTSTFLGIGRALGWVLVAAGIATVLAYRRRMGIGARGQGQGPQAPEPDAARDA